jgi:hypothetical protein
LTIIFPFGSGSADAATKTHNTQRMNFGILGKSSRLTTTSPGPVNWNSKEEKRIMNVASISLQAGKNVGAGEKISIESLFPWQDYDEVTKVFDLSQDICRGMPITVHISKCASMEALADIDKKVGQKPSIGLWMLLSFNDLRKETLCNEPVEKDEWLTVTITV